MAVIPRKAGSASARPNETRDGVTVLGRPPLSRSQAARPAPSLLDSRDRLHLDALKAHTWRSWHDRLADLEAELAPEAAAGFAARVGTEFDAGRERTLADLPIRLRADAAAGLDAIGAEIVGTAREYEDLAGRVDLFNKAKRATDDIAALILHDPSSYEHLREEGLALLARAPLSDDGRKLVEQHFDRRLSQALAAAHSCRQPGKWRFDPGRCARSA